MNRFRGTVASLIGTLALVCAGCRDEASYTAPAASNAGLQSSDRGDVLFNAVAGQLRNLSNQIDTELTPPAVILDAKSSGDGQDVMAICTTHPDVPDGPINYLSVAGTPNSRFRSLGVRPGDIVKYYASYDEESMETGIYQAVAMDLVVAQVLSDNALLFEGGLTMPVLEPAKIEVWRYVDDRLNELTRALNTYETYRTPPLDWEPTPDARVLKQIVERLNQWMRQSQPKVNWIADPLLNTIEPKIAGDDRVSPLINDMALADSVFQPFDGRMLQEAIWHRDIARWAQGTSLSPVERATALFDWTIRNMQLDADSAESERLPLRPWEVLMFGHGTAEQRAWVFAELCRQQGLTVVMLSVPSEAKPHSEGESSEGSTSFWLPALLSDGQLYLFDTRLGLPIPGLNGDGVATLAQLQSDPQLLTRLNLADTPYSVAQEQLQRIAASPVADRFQLTRRAAAIEGKLRGDDRIVLTARPSAIVDELKAMPGITAVTLWDFPFRTLRDQVRIPEDPRRRMKLEFEPFAWQPTLWKARVLHFRGRHSEPSPTDPTADVVDDHAEAIQLYTSRTLRPRDRSIEKLGSPSRQRIYNAAKDASSYWVGLLLYEDGKYPTAEHWFHDPRLSAGAGNPWRGGTLYNLGRTYEAEGKFDDAITRYEEDTSPQRHGNRLRGEWLKEKPRASPPPEAADAGENS